MNLKSIDDIVPYNQINQLYNLLQGEVLIDLKDIIGIEGFISVSPAGKEINNLPDARFIRYGLSLMPHNEIISVNIPDYFLSEFLSKISGGTKNCALTTAGLALFEYIFLKIISRERKSEIIQRLRWIGIIKERTSEKELMLIFKVNFMEGVYFFSVGFTERGTQEIITIMEKSHGTERFPDVPINIIPVLAEGEIKTGELREIHPGDVIAFREPYIKLYENGKTGGVIMFKTGDNELIGGYDIDNKRFFCKNETGEEKQKEREQNVEELIQNIPVTVSIELKRIKMLLKDLTHLVPGQLLDIQGKPPDEVLISANGKVIGTGRLIRIDDVLCVEVLTIKD